MAESDQHKELKARAIKYLWDKSYFTARVEVYCGHYGIYDAWGINGEFATIGIEVKVSRADFKNNKKKEIKLDFLRDRPTLKHAWYHYWIPANKSFIKITDCFGITVID